MEDRRHTQCALARTWKFGQIYIIAYRHIARDRRFLCFFIEKPEISIKQKPRLNVLKPFSNNSLENATFSGLSQLQNEYSKRIKCEAGTCLAAYAVNTTLIHFSDVVSRNLFTCTWHLFRYICMYMTYSKDNIITFMV